MSSSNTSVIAWGAKVSGVFLKRVRWIAEDLEMGYNTPDGMSKLMSCIAWEADETFSASIKNMAGSGATGLIQFMPKTALMLGTSVTALANMTAEDQLNYVWKYFAPYKGRLKELSDIYMAILWPKAVGKPEDYVLWDASNRPTTYRQNAGLDINKDRKITKGEATKKVSQKLAKGMRFGNSVQFDELPEMQEQAVLPEHDNVLEPPPETPEDVTVYVEKETPAVKAKKAASGWPGKLTGVIAIVSALLVDPNFSRMLSDTIKSISQGNITMGAILALIGAGLMVYRHAPRKANSIKQ